MVKRVNEMTAATGGNWPDARRLLARTLFREMKAEGLDSKKMLEFTNELLGLVQTEVSGVDETN